MGGGFIGSAGRHFDLRRPMKSRKAIQLLLDRFFAFLESKRLAAIDRGGSSSWVL
jgi:hypothetical protein